MLGAIAGDVIGSVYEVMPTRDPQFELFPTGARFTDDTVLTVATAEVVLEGGDYRQAYQRYFAQWPDAGFGGMFAGWASSRMSGAYNSFGNGSGMRVSPVGWAFEHAPSVDAEAVRSASVTHSHPEGVRGARAVALGVFFARQGLTDREALRHALMVETGYDLERRLADIRPDYAFDVTAPGSVPESLIAALEAEGFEQAVRNAVALGGDADTMGAMAGAVAEARFGGVPADIREQTLAHLPAAFVDIVHLFRQRFGVPWPP